MRDKRNKKNSKKELKNEQKKQKNIQSQKKSQKKSQIDGKYPKTIATHFPKLHLEKNDISKLKSVLYDYNRTLSKSNVKFTDPEDFSSDDENSDIESNSTSTTSWSDDLSTHSSDLESLIADDMAFEDEVAEKWLHLCTTAFKSPENLQSLVDFNHNILGIKAYDPPSSMLNTKELKLIREEELHDIRQQLETLEGELYFDDFICVISIKIDFPIDLIQKETTHHQFGQKANLNIDCLLETHFSVNSQYPYESPVFAVLSADTSIDTKLLMNLTQWLQKTSRDWIGHPMIMEAYWWLKGNHAQSALWSNPAEYISTDAFENMHSSPCSVHPGDINEEISTLIDKANTLSINPQTTPKKLSVDKTVSTKKISKGFGLNSVSTNQNSPVKNISNSDKNIYPVVKSIYCPLVIPNEDVENQKLYDSFKNQCISAKYQKHQEWRETLPAWKQKEEIVTAILNNQVVVICGETGCGKSTQVPQFILDSCINSKNGARCNIFVTQPRRISAIGLAERVSNERGESVGKSVGYSIRLENRVSNLTKILYCTTGILLRKLEQGSSQENDFMKDVSHVIVDEVHERSIDSDFLLMILKDLLKVRHDLKVILMSATLNASMFSDYFGHNTPILTIPGRTFPVEALFLEDILETVDYIPSPEYSKKLFKEKKSRSSTETVDELNLLNDCDLQPKELNQRYPKSSKPTLKTLSLIDVDKIQYPLLEKLVLKYGSAMLGVDLKAIIPGASTKKSKNKSKPVSTSKSPKNDTNPSFTRPKQQEFRGILIFLSGIAEISTLHELLISNPLIRAITNNGKLCLALHSSLSTAEQKLVFERPPEGSIKVIISTNVAETSITIDDIVLVIDSGRMKETRFDPTKGMVSLEECWTSRANSTQRRGRAGRVMAGVCIHMFTSHRYKHVFDNQQLPEMLRTPLEQLCLRIKILPFLTGKIADILERVIEPPSLDSVKAAISTLQSLQALSHDEKLTPLGFHLGKLPVDVRIGKLILFGCIFNCLDPVLTIAAIMSVKSPFVAPFEKRFMAEEKKSEFSLGDSDHLTLLNVYNEWIKNRSQGRIQENKFLWDNFLSGKTLNMIMLVKRQFAELLSDIGFIGNPITTRSIERADGFKSDGVIASLVDKDLNRRYDDYKVIKAVMIAALYPNVVKVGKEEGNSKKKFKLFVQGKEEVFIHPSSIHKKTTAYPQFFMVYLEKVKTSKVYIRDATFVNSLALAIFGGNLYAKNKGKQLEMDNGFITFSCNKMVSEIFIAIRKGFDEALAAKIANPQMKLSSIKLVEAIIGIISNAR